MQKMKRIVCVAVAAVLAGAVAENVQLNPGTYRAAPEGFPGAVLVTADADGAPHFDCVGEAAPGRRMEPDTKYLYSNWDIDVAAAIVEKVTGRPFDVEMAERIFKPLGMTDSTFIPNASQNAHRATFYKLSDKKPPMPTKIVRDKLAPPYMEVGVHPEAGGGLLSTPRDMIKFFQMIARGGLTPDGRRLISAPLMEKWTAKQTPSCVKVGYSFGMKVDGKGSLSHGGAAGTWAEANVKTRKARLYMVNVQGSSKVAKSFRDDWMKKTALSVKKAK